MKTPFIYIILLFTALVLGSCSEEEVVKTPIASAKPQVAAATVSTLSFSWDAIADATQYGYRLLDAKGNAVAGDVTTALSCQITDLNYDTPYTFKLTSFAAYEGDKGNSSEVSIDARTNAQEKLVLTGVDYDDTTIPVTVWWDAVPEAYAYRYAYESADKSIYNEKTITSCEAVLPNQLAEGDYNFTLVALADTTQEEYINSDPYVFAFHMNGLPSYDLSWTSALDKENHTATLVDNLDETYVLKNYYGVDLVFTVSETTHKITFKSGGTLNGYYYTIETNLTGTYASARINVDKSTADIAGRTIKLVYTGPGNPTDVLTW